MDQNSKFLLIAIGATLAFQIGKKVYSIKKGKKFIDRDDVLVIDVRTEREFKGDHHPRSKNIPLAELESRLKEIPMDQPIMLCCASGMRSGIAKGMLKKKGYQDLFNAGTYRNLFRIFK